MTKPVDLITSNHAYGPVASFSKKDLAFAIVIIVALYQTYRVYRSLVDRIDTLNDQLKAAQSKITELEKKQTTQAQEIVKLQAAVAENEFVSCDEGDDQELDLARGFVRVVQPVDEEESVQKAGDEPREPERGKTPLELFKEHVPGKNLKCSYQHRGKEINTTCADYLMATLFRVNEVQECLFDEKEHSFTLTYAEPKKIVVKELAQEVWDKMSMAIKAGVSGLLYFKPELTFSSTLKGRFNRVSDAVEIALDPTAVTLTPIWMVFYSVTGSLKSIEVPDRENESLFVLSEHNVPKINQKGGHVNYAPVVRFTAPFFFKD